MTLLVGDLRAAVATLTRLPVGAVVDGRAGAAAFPLVGLGIGLVAAVPVALLGPTEPTLAAIMAVALAALASGALHLDALADTADALMAPDPARAEVARRDPRLGSGGAVALILVIGADVAAIASLAGGATPALAAAAVVVAATVARAMPVVLVVPWAGRPARGAEPAEIGDAPGVPRASTGDWFVAQVRRRDAVVALILALLPTAAAALLAGPTVVVGAAVGAGLGVAAGLAIRALRGRWDGDALGASIELTALAILVATAVAHG
jgi:adenosylcobinamide-GDP ribazoletransferase